MCSTHSGHPGLGNRSRRGDGCKASGGGAGDAGDVTRRACSAEVPARPLTRCVDRPCRGKVDARSGSSTALRRAELSRNVTSPLPIPRVSPDPHRSPAGPPHPGVSEAATACPGRLRDARASRPPAAGARALARPRRRGVEARPSPGLPGLEQPAARSFATVLAALADCVRSRGVSSRRCASAGRDADGRRGGPGCIRARGGRRRYGSGRSRRCGRTASPRSGRRPRRSPPAGGR